MGILRADLLTHSQLQPTGSVFFDGTDDKITTTGFGNIGTSDFTLECWVYLSTTSGTQRIISANEGSQSTEYTQIRAHSTHGWQGYIGTDSGWWEGKSGNDHSTFTTGWHHVVLQRFGNDGYIFVDGEYVITSNDGSSASNAADPVTVTTFVLGHGYGSEYLNAGYISNARVSMKAVYGGTDFTPPKFELRPLGETYLLCCQSSSSSSEATVAPSAGLTVTGAAASSFTPDLKKDITDTGVVFDGFGSFATSTYMVPPRGKTTERNRGRAVMPVGARSPYLSILGLDIQSEGISQDFGDLRQEAQLPGTASSSTRMLVTMGYTAPAQTNTIDFITIANIASSTDFGDLTEARRRTQSLSNSTRGVHVGGTGQSPKPYFNTIDYSTIATLGNATEFGDTLAAHVATGGSVASSTRGVYSVGYLSGSYVNTLEYITIATTGNGQDFGDLNGGTIGYHFRGSTCDSTRGLFSGGYDPAGNVQNKIDFITIASTGNATDFGDLTVARRSAAGTSNSIKSVFMGGYLPGVANVIDSVIIQTTGNAKDFGDLIIRTNDTSASSDSHGGLS